MQFLPTLLVGASALVACVSAQTVRQLPNKSHPEHPGLDCSGLTVARPQPQSQGLHRVLTLIANFDSLSSLTAIPQTLPARTILLWVSVITSSSIPRQRYQTPSMSLLGP